MPTDDPGLVLVLLILALGLVGILVVFMLLVMWRRHLQRQKRLRDRQPTPLVDAWQASAQRLEIEVDDEDDTPGDDNGSNRKKPGQ